ncbi:hypothetical protein Tco_1138470 [Tanacetum coccineum]
MNEEQRAQIARDEEIARQWDEEERQRATTVASSNDGIWLNTENQGKGNYKISDSREVLLMTISGQFLKEIGGLIMERYTSIELLSFIRSQVQKLESVLEKIIIRRQKDLIQKNLGFEINHKCVGRIVGNKSSSRVNTAKVVSSCFADLDFGLCSLFYSLCHRAGSYESRKSPTAVRLMIDTGRISIRHCDIL